jgi:hypothetical protein
MSKIIPLEIAKLAKSKGYFDRTYSQYAMISEDDYKLLTPDEVDEADIEIGLGNNLLFSAPPQCILIDWILEKFNIYIDVDFMVASSSIVWIVGANYCMSANKLDELGLEVIITVIDGKDKVKLINEVIEYVLKNVVK